MKKFLIILLTGFLISSILLMLYPTVTKDINRQNENKNYEVFIHNNDKADKKEETDNIDRKALYIDSLEYNESLYFNQRIIGNFSQKALDLSKYNISDNIYGYINIEKIDLNLPIILGASEENMKNGSAHLYSTSLPLPNNHSNCVLAAHTGFLSKTFFDNISHLNNGDKIKVTSYINTCTYEVYDKKTISPYDTSSLSIKSNSDILTLMTCTNFGKDRLVVFAKLI